MIVVTGGAGFIGSAMVWKLNQAGITDILVVDILRDASKWKNLAEVQYEEYMHRDQFLAAVKNHQLPRNIEAIFHLGACSATTEADADYLMQNNYEYTKLLSEWCLKNQSRFIYASSAATYGDGSNGYSDDLGQIDTLVPMNMYGYSKQLFDLKAKREGWFDQIVGLKFFNVFGPNEYHKGRMTSVMYHAFGQIKEHGSIKLFKSYKPEYAHGEQMRDFIYVKDVVDVMYWFLQNPKAAGLFNLGTGQARSWNDLAKSVFAALNLEEKIEYIEMPENIRQHYQYFTQAEMQKLKEIGCPKSFSRLEETVKDYVTCYLDRDYAHLNSLPSSPNQVHNDQDQSRLSQSTDCPSRSDAA
jgi:ADP-L-glycero-D-manno-heptose 6-epimerase